MVVFKLRMSGAKPQIMELLRQEKFSALTKEDISEKLPEASKRSVSAALGELSWFGLVTRFDRKGETTKYGISERGLELTAPKRDS